MPNCPACKSANPASAKFCNECGAPLAALSTVPAPASAASLGYTPQHLVEKVLKSRAALQGERKRVTVLFADIQGSTQIAELTGAENWHLILEGFFEILTKAVHRYEGTVNQYTGDGIMALFGAPIAHEDHAQRACLAALAMQQQMGRYSQEMSSRYRVSIGMRVGLNSGEVVVGRIGDDLRMDYTAQGLTVNLAQRMENLCAAGRITLTRNTSAQLQGHFRLRDLGSKLVHGVSTPIEVFELEGENALPSTSAVAQTWTQTRFIGREAELAALQNAAERTRTSGRGELLLLSGGAGLGKTRLCREFSKRCLTAGMDFTRSACLPYARAIPLWPIRRLLRQKLGIREGMPVAEAQRLAEAALTALNSPHAAALQSRWLEFLDAAEDSQAAQTQGLGLRRRLLDLVAASLLSSGTPQLLLIEDVQWADPASEEFLKRLAEDVRGQLGGQSVPAGSKTMLLLNYRPDFAEGGARAFQALAAISLNLGEFAGQDLQQLAGDWLGAHPSVREVALRVQERTGGNPFFLEEAVRDLEQSGYLRGTRGAYELVRPIGEWHIPDTVHALLAARMDRLPSEQKTLLQTAAAVGQKFNLKLLADLSDAPLYDVADRVHALEAAGFLRRPGKGVDGEFTVSHALMQEVAYQTLLESQRKTLHARLAECLERMHPQSASPCEQWISIAYHFEKSGQWAKAGAWNLAAVQWALRWDARALLDQVRHAIHNLNRADEAPEVLKQRIVARAQLIRSAVHAQVAAQDVDNAYQEGLQLAKRLRDLHSHAELQSSYGIEQLRRGDAARAVALTRQAAQLMETSTAGVDAMPFAAYALYAHNIAGRLEEGQELARLLAGENWLAQPLNTRNYEVRAQHVFTLTYLGRLAEAKGEIQILLEFARNDANLAGWLHAFAVELVWYLGDYEPALEHAHASLRHAEALNSSHLRAVALRALGIAHILRDDHAQAIPILEEARPLFAGGAAAQVLQAGLLAALAEAYRGAGETARAAETAETGIAIARRSHTRIQEIQCWLALLVLPRDGHWKVRVPIALARLEELLASTGATVFLPWWCQCQARWAPDLQSRHDWLRQAADAFTQMGATPHVKRLTQTG